MTQRAVNSGSPSPQGDASAEGGSAVRAWRRVRDWFRENSWSAGSAVLLFVILLILAWPYIAITILPGHGGVFYSRFFGGVERDRIYDEGIHFIWPWNRMYDFDARIQQEAYDMVILMDSGMSVQVSLVCNHHLIKDRLPELLQTVGEDYRKRLLLPALNTSVRSVLGNYDFEDSHWMLRRLQDEVQTKAIELLQSYPVIVDTVAVTNITLPERLSEAINRKQEANQNYLAERFRVMQAEQQFRRSYIEAEAVRVTQETVSAGLTEPFLRWSGIQATRDLAASPNAKMVLIGGGKDGLPVILNPDAPNSLMDNKAPSRQNQEKEKSDAAEKNESPTAPEALTAEKLKAETGQSLLERSENALSDITKRLDRMSSGILEELSAGIKAKRD